MAYLKPQNPIKDRNGDYFYPLTTADQVIMEDGSRLNSKIAIPMKIESGGTGATNANDARRNLEITPDNIGALSMELLWENASPTSSFREQRVTLDVSQFDFFIVKVIATTTMGRYTYNIIKNEELTQALTGIVGDGRTVYRDMIPSGRNNVYFSIGLLCSNNSITENNTCCIPVEIYGIKGVSA